MREATKTEFFAAMTGNVHPKILPGPYPYTSEWRLRPSNRVVGKSVGYIPHGKGLEETRWYLSDGPEEVIA